MKKIIISLVIIIGVIAVFFGTKAIISSTNLGEVEGYVCKVNSEEKQVYICSDESEASEEFEMILDMDYFVVENDTKLVNFNSLDELQIGDKITVQYAGTILEVEPSVIEDVKIVTLQ